MSHWVAMAQSVVNFPEQGEGAAWRASVPPLVTLQALAWSLNELHDRIDAADRAVAIDKAAVMIGDAVAALHRAWAEEAMPEGPHAAVAAARTALHRAARPTWAWRVTEDGFTAEHPADLAAVLLAGGAAPRRLLTAAPGVPLFTDSPAAVIEGHPGGIEPPTLALITAFLGEGVAAARRVPAPIQAYRQWDFATGRVMRDVVAWLDGEPLAGQPLLVPVILDGVAQAVSLPPRRVDLGAAAVPVFLADDVADAMATSPHAG